jgi:serine/threonine protein phosphatase 1
MPSAGPGVAYAVGDIHGRADLLAAIVSEIEKRDGRANPPPRIVFLGDLVDRGPQSREVVDAVLELRAAGWCSVEVLKGNHEDMMLKFLDGSPIGAEWMKLGGAATLRSYGVRAPGPLDPPSDWEETRQAFADAVPAPHLEFIRSLPHFLERGDYLFVHAGVKPNVPMEMQRSRDLMWIRGEFGRCERPNEKVVIYGHTVFNEPSIKRWKIGLDTGAYGTGVLTAMRLEETDRALLRTSPTGLVHWTHR